MARPRRPLAPATRLAHAARAAVVDHPARGAAAVPERRYASPAWSSSKRSSPARARLLLLSLRHAEPRAAGAAVADLEGAEAAVAAASGMAALSATLLALLAAGDHVVVDRHIYGGTYALVTAELPRFGMPTAFVDLAAPDALAAAAQPTTRLLVLETLTNPTAAGHRPAPPRRRGPRARAVVVCVDNTFTTPCLIQPLAHGADLVWHRPASTSAARARCSAASWPGRGPARARARNGDSTSAWRAGRSTPGWPARGWPRWRCAWSAAAPTRRRSRPGWSSIRRWRASTIRAWPAIPSTRWRSGSTRTATEACCRFELVGGAEAARAPSSPGLQPDRVRAQPGDVTTTVGLPAGHLAPTRAPDELAAMGVRPRPGAAVDRHRGRGRRAGRPGAALASIAAGATRRGATPNEAAVAGVRRSARRARPDALRRAGRRPQPRI